MRKTIVAATVGASIAIGGLAGSALGGPGLAGAADIADGADGDEDGGWVQDALSGLVDDGTITQDQADAVEEALGEARPEGGFGHGGFLGRMDLSTVAEALGVSEDDLRSALEDGRTVAEVAEDEGVEVQDVVDAIVAAQQERLDQAVEDGDLTQEQADDILAGAEERATAFVEGEMPAPDRLPHPPGEGEGDGPGTWGHGPEGWHDGDRSDDSERPDDEGTDESEDPGDAEGTADTPT